MACGERGLLSGEGRERRRATLCSPEADSRNAAQTLCSAPDRRVFPGSSVVCRVSLKREAR